MHLIGVKNSFCCDISTVFSVDSHVIRWSIGSRRKNLVLLPCLWQTVIISWWLSHQFRICDGISRSSINKWISKGRCIYDACSTEFLSLPLMTLSSKWNSALLNRLPQTVRFMMCRQQLSPSWSHQYDIVTNSTVAHYFAVVYGSVSVYGLRVSWKSRLGLLVIDDVNVNTNFS